jgi:ribonuclease BN (tRNA processing enzyme)
MSSPIFDRRQFLSAAGGMAALALLPRWTFAPAGKTRLILLGTGGGPRPRKGRNASSQVIIVNDVPYVIDCGDGVARQLVIAGVALNKLGNVFITHHHSDHNADYGNLLLLAWVSGLRTRVDTWGPPPLEKITQLFLEMSAPDIDVRIADQGIPPLAPLIHVHELTAAGPVMQDENVKVTCALVDHPPMVPSFAYRFDSADRSIVISGDTNRSANLEKLAQGADVLVHEAMWVPAVDGIVGNSNGVNRAALKAHFINSHTAVEDCGRVAAAAGVKTLVLSHLVPSDDPAITDQMWIDAARQYFSGEIIVGRDLLDI